MPDTQTSHPLDSLHTLLVEIVNRLPWHSEVQAAQMMDLARGSEVALKGDEFEASGAVVPPAPVGTPPATPAEVASASGIDYDRLASAIVDAQARQKAAADEQMAQAAAAVQAEPGFVTPGAAGATPESHAAVTG